MTELDSYVENKGRSKMGKEFEGLSDLEVIKLINKKKKRYCAIALNELEEENLDEVTFKKIRKIFLDNINSYTRSMFTIIGIEIEGAEE